MPLVVMLLVEKGGGEIPVCRSRDVEAVRHVAKSALAEARNIAGKTRDPMLSALFHQEIDRLLRAYETLGLGEDV